MADAVQHDAEQFVEIPEDYRAFTEFRDTGELPAPKDAPAEGEETTPPSEPDEESGQTAEGSDPEEEAEQESEESQETDPKTEDKEPAAKTGNRLNRRMRELTGEIKALKSQLGELTNQPEDEEETAEVVSAPEPAAVAEKAARPMLKDFEDTDDKSAWDQYEEALAEYNRAETAATVAAALKDQRDKLELEHAKASAQAEWNRAASRFPDFNEVVRAEVKISSAMESVMRMDPEAGTALAYYLGQHPEESERIAKATLANSESQWTSALARAGMELGAIRAKLSTPGPKAVPNAKTTPAPTPQPKKVTGASKPPTQIRGGVVPPRTDVMSDDDAGNYKKWRAARDAQLQRK